MLMSKSAQVFFLRPLTLVNIKHYDGLAVKMQHPMHHRAYDYKFKFGKWLNRQAGIDTLAEVRIIRPEWAFDVRMPGSCPAEDGIQAAGDIDAEFDPHQSILSTLQCVEMRPHIQFILAAFNRLQSRPRRSK